MGIYRHIAVIHVGHFYRVEVTHIVRSPLGLTNKVIVKAMGLEKASVQQPTYL